MLQCCCINVKGFPHPSPHPKPQSPPQSKPKGVCGCYSVALSMSRASPRHSPHPKPQSHPSLSLKVCVGATVLLYQCQGLLNPSPPSLSLKVCVWVLQCCCINVKGFPHPSPHPKPPVHPQSKPKGVGATVLLYQCQGLPPPQSPP